jgi:hypothetical protein
MGLFVNVAAYMGASFNDKYGFSRISARAMTALVKPDPTMR